MSRVRVRSVLNHGHIAKWKPQTNPHVRLIVGVLICELTRRWKPLFVASRTSMYARTPRGTSAVISQIIPPMETASPFYLWILNCG